MALFTIKDLTFYYPECKKAVLSHINFEIKDGEFLVLCGKSGCGKTTLLRHFKSVLTPYGKRTGEIRFRDIPLSEVDLRTQAGLIGYVMQNPEHQIVTDKVWHELAFGLENLGYEQNTIRLRVAEMASFFGIQSWFYKDVEQLSGGQKQILNLASILAMRPEVLVLDEPTAQLDPIAAGEFLVTLSRINKELGTTIIISEHHLEEVMSMADRVLVLEEGKQLVLGRSREVGAAIKRKDLFQIMPTPVQIYEEIGQREESPLTVREGKNWLSEICPQPKIITCTDGTESSKRNSDHLKEEDILITKNLWYRYERNLPDVIKGVSLHVKKGELFCLLGGNGTGKSTLLSLLCGIRKPVRGKLWLNGKEIKHYKNAELYSDFLGVLPQNPQSVFVGDTVYEDLMEMLPKSDSSNQKQARIEEVSEMVQLQNLLTMHPYDLSGGEQQRAALAKVLLLKPKLLLLDEPTKGLDGIYKAKLADIFYELKKKGITIFMVSHDIEFCAAYGDTCGLFFDGNMIACRDARSFFSDNSFYTTAAHRMSSHLFVNAVTVKDVISLCKINLSL